MTTEQDEFKGEMEELDRTISNFSQYTNIKDHQTVSSLATDLNEKLREF